MTAKEFLSKAAAYYGDYRPAVAEAILEYLGDKPQGFTASLWQVIITKFEGKYPPQLATLQNYSGEAWGKARFIEDEEQTTHWEARLIPEWTQVALQLIGIKARLPELEEEDLIKIGKYLSGSYPDDAVYYVRLDNYGRILEEQQDRPAGEVDGDAKTVDPEVREHNRKFAVKLYKDWMDLKGGGKV